MFASLEDFDRFIKHMKKMRLVFITLLIFVFVLKAKIKKLILTV